MKAAGVFLIAWAGAMAEGKRVAERNETWNLCEGLGRIRWEDELARIRRWYPEAYPKRRRFGRNPKTGEVIEVVPALVVPRFLAVSDELFMDASFENELSRSVVVDMSRNRVEVEAGLEASNVSELQGKKVEEQRPIGLGGERYQPALCGGVGLFVDEPQVVGLPAQGGP